MMAQQPNERESSRTTKRGILRDVPSAHGACAVVLATCLLASAAGLAAPPGSGDAESKRSALYKEGVALSDSGNWAEALNRFQQVVAIRSSPPALFSLAEAEQHVGRYASSETHYRAALADARSTHDARVQAAAEKAIGAVVPHVPHLVVRVATEAPNRQATVDGAPASLGAPYAVDPGDHAVVVTADGMRPFQRKVHAEDGQSIDVSATLVALEPGPSPTATAAPSTTAEPPPTTRRTFPVGPAILAGGGVVLGVAGFLVHAGGQSDFDAANAQCMNMGCPSQSVVDAGNSGRTRVYVGYTMVGVGAAAIGAAGLWWLLGHWTVQDSVGVSMSPAGVALDGRF